MCEEILMYMSKKTQKKVSRTNPELLPVVAEPDLAALLVAQHAVNHAQTPPVHTCMRYMYMMMSEHILVEVWLTRDIRYCIYIVYATLLTCTMFLLL